VPADLVNIIEYNPIDMAVYRKPDPENVEKFMTTWPKTRQRKIAG
jgi:23S rRNA (adenine2503-C2)-methyltransferase